MGTQAFHGSVSTGSASKYLQQLCKHFAHKVPATWSPEEGTVEFPFGQCHMLATETDLRFACKAEPGEQSERLKHVVESHLERFAWRETLALHWDGGGK